MHWNNATEFFAMGGYALYVWGSFGVCAIGMLAEPLLIRRRRGEVLRTLRERLDDERELAHQNLGQPNAARPSLASSNLAHPKAR